MPNDDLISRKALLDKLTNELNWAQSINASEEGLAAFRIAISYVKAANAVDAEPVRHGKWEKANCSGFIVCSSCKDVFLRSDWFLNGSKWDYCPACGAKMDLEEDTPCTP
jgi:hypothetical protein